MIRPIPKASTLGRSLVRRGCLALVALILPACGYGSGGSNYHPMIVGGGPSPLMSENFLGTLPDADFNTPTVSNATATTGLYIAPNYYLDFHASAARGAGIMASATALGKVAFVHSSITVSVGLQATSSTTQVDTGSIVLQDSVSMAVLARMDLDSSAKTAHFMGTATTVTGLSTGSFHTFVFKVDSMGNATWSVDGGSAIMVTYSPGMMAMLALGLEANFAGATATADPDFFFTNVLVTSP